MAPNLNIWDLRKTAYLFSDASQTSAAFRVLDGGGIIGKSSQVDRAGLPAYFIRYRRPDQS